MSDVWFTSDWHLGHYNIIKYCNRPFKTVGEMNEAILENHNALVKPGDLVFHHGDIMFNMSYDKCYKLMCVFNGLIHVLKGNHDKVSVLKRFLTDKLIVSYQDVLEKQFGSSRFWMSHYAHRTWHHAYRGVIHTFGHNHASLPPSGRSFDCGVDAWDYKPVHIDTALELAAKLGKVSEPKFESSPRWNGPKALEE